MRDVTEGNTCYEANTARSRWLALHFSALAALAAASASPLKNLVIVHAALAEGFRRSFYSCAARSGLGIPLSLAV